MLFRSARTAARAAGLDVEFVHGFLGRAAIAPASADFVTIRNVLWTLADPDAVLRLAFRVLRPGGLVLVDNANAFGLIAIPNLDPAADDTPRHGSRVTTVADMASR